MYKLHMYIYAKVQGTSSSADVWEVGDIYSTCGIERLFWAFGATETLMTHLHWDKHPDHFYVFLVQCNRQNFKFCCFLSNNCQNVCSSSSVQYVTMIGDVALMVVLWRPALSASSSSLVAASVTALRWEPVNVHRGP